ncbi:MAG TPA: glycosyltransferase [Ohtaekwangia sp.]|uniref:glycosyltransferase n=1 Tax=Ohtaekwangia sp. TaxID=2066019 RepID=UPI002F95ED17
MARILFLCYHGKGHFNPYFHLARVLQQSHHVLFSGVAYFHQYIAAQGFQYYPLNTVPFGLGLEEWLCQAQKRTPVYWNALKDRWNDHLYTIRKQELTALLDQYKPDVILLDTNQTTDFIVLYPLLKERKIRFGLVHAMLTSVLTENFPPVNSLVFPDDREGIKREIKLLRKKKQKRLWLQKLKFFGMDDNAILKRRMRRNNIPAKYISEEERYYGVVLKGLEELIFLPREFDFREAKVYPGHHHVGFQIDYARQEQGSKEYKEIKDRILEKVNAEGVKVVYCAFGTVPIEDKQTFIVFIKKLAEALMNQRVVLLLATSLELGDLSIKRNVYVQSYVPQLDVLTYADAFITHGGLNSIKEAIDRGVPMLVYPGESVMDPPGNSTRVVYHGLGLRGDMITDSVEDIAAKVNRLLTEEQFRNNVKRLRKINDTYSLEQAIKLLENMPVIE